DEKPNPGVAAFSQGAECGQRSLELFDAAALRAQLRGQRLLWLQLPVEGAGLAIDRAVLAMQHGGAGEQEHDAERGGVAGGFPAPAGGVADPPCGGEEIDARVRRAVSRTNAQLR